jgi:hypothetical protein
LAIQGNGEVRMSSGVERGGTLEKCDGAIWGEFTDELLHLSQERILIRVVK